LNEENFGKVPDSYYQTFIIGIPLNWQFFWLSVALTIRSMLGICQGALSSLKIVQLFQ
jgi:hypothetical protein